MVSAQWFGKGGAWVASVLRRYSLQASSTAPGTTPCNDDSAHVSQPLGSNHTPPGHSSAPLSDDPLSSCPSPSAKAGGRLTAETGPGGVTPGSSAPGTKVEPIFVGPPGAPTPS